MVKIKKLGGPVKYATRSKTAYNILDTLLSTVFFMVFYFYLILPMEFSLMKYVYIFLSAIISGLLGSYTSRFMTHYWQYDNKNFQHILRNLINSITYAFIIWIGFIASVFTLYDLTTIMGIMQLFLSLMFIKLLVFFASDYYADRIAFQG